jgi:ATP-dependent protease ClpP protease subunit
MAFRFGKQAAAKNRTRPIFQASVQTDGTLEMLVYGEIVDMPTLSMLEDWGYPTDGLISATSVKKQIDAAGTFSRIRVRINSPGGDAFEGIAICNLLRAQGKPIETCIDGIAASSASIIAMAGDVRTAGHNAMMMIHNAWSVACGDAVEMRKMADILDKISESIAQTYVDRTGKTMAEIKALMDAETWMSADDCVRDGFATAIAEPATDESDKAMAMARGFRALNKMKHVPAALKPANQAECECDCENCQTGDCQNCTNQDCSDANCTDCPMQAGSGNSSNLSLYEARLSMLSK